MPDAEERLARAELARVLRKTIRERSLAQSEAAEKLSVKQPDISDLMRGKLERFNRERLERFLTTSLRGAYPGQRASKLETARRHHGRSR
ncbi:MAG: helix-turn-helix domain-containing protein [Longimicrobiales bacterium]